MSARPPSRALSLGLTALIAALLATRLWSAWCVFPLHAWNDVRLVPTFMLAAGMNPYPGVLEGPVTTWIYGPLPLLVNIPALFASSATVALQIAGALNLLLAVGAAWIAARHATTPSPTAPSLWAFLLCLAAWPGSSLLYIQADNLALLCALASNALLLRPGRGAMLGAAACAIGACLSKQTYAGLVLGQLVWLAFAKSPREALRYVFVCAILGLASAAVFIGWFGFDGLWLNLVTLPGSLPFWTDPLDRAAGLRWHLVFYVGLPVLVLAASGRRAWRADSIWSLPATTWLFLLPLAVLGCFKLGGTVNSLHAFVLLLPPAAAIVVRWTETKFPRAAPALLATACLVLQAEFVAHATRQPLAPANQHLEQADFLARELAGEIYFPWNPLVTYFAERRFYHAEDGLYVRFTAGRPVNLETFRRHVPPRWTVTVFRRNDEGWGIVRQFHPPGTQVTAFGGWSVHSWTSTPPANP